MASIQAKISKKLLPIFFGRWSGGTIAEQRAKQETIGKAARLPRQLICQPVTVAGVPAEWIALPEADAGVMLYLHGGAYNLGSVNASRDRIARLVAATRHKALALDYRLAPENPFPAALEDAVAAYRWLLAEGTAPGRILFAGDSAGGGLAVATLVALRDAGLPLPAGAVCISPWVDLALTGDSIHSKAAADPILDAASLARYAATYAGDAPLTSPLISPLYADLHGLPPLLILAGTEEILLDDATRLAEKAGQAGVAVTLATWEGLFHVFPVVGFLPETRQAMQQVGAFAAGLSG
jgi:epsilon-lactone hydrolase